jgi:hypothetical protein|tara:strand:+ start:224 stop:442 length:219 start_codon:yes stop_codon:yes gene_type:complete
MRLICVKPGDLVKIVNPGEPIRTGPDSGCTWPESLGQIGMIIREAKRLYIPSAKVLVLGEIAEFDLDELEIQ